MCFTFNAAVTVLSCFSLFYCTKVTAGTVSVSSQSLLMFWLEGCCSNRCFTTRNLTDTSTADDADNFVRVRFISNLKNSMFNVMPCGVFFRI